ncbi:MAG: cell wall metabolism sensor histidine kinase WalK [Actinobacteria bacterium]|nr:cell wall metabolism sensor histidine kinase WalK [Actinomycetota bacterium]
MHLTRKKINLSLANKLFLVFFSVFVFGVFIIAAVVVPQLKTRLTDQKLRNLGDYATLYSESYLTALNQGSSRIGLDLLTQQYAERADARILAVDSSGNLLSDSLMGQGFDSGDYAIANDAFNSGNLATNVTSINGRSFAMAAVPVSKNNRIVAAIIVSSSMSDVDSAVRLVGWLMFAAGTAALVIASVVIYLVSHFVSRRIRRIESGAQQIAEGDFDIKLPVRSADELGQLAMTFNDMGSKLGSAFQQVDNEKRRAKVLLDDLSEGVIGIDVDGNIIVANPAAEGLLGREITVPCSLKECLPDEIYELWLSMNPQHPFREDTFMLPRERAMQVHTSFLSDQAELVSLLVLRDVSQEVKMEKSRRDFIANASHELKTPLFSLGGFLELLQDEDVDESTKEEFVATMREQVDRLSDLARKLLDLSQMDSGAIDVRASRVELKDVVDTVAREFTAYSVSHDSRVDTSALPEDLVASCDPDRTAQLARILIDNALKYSPEGAAVQVSGSHNGKSVSFTVADHGPGIPADELPRVFERFYRGRAAGRIRGTGLGLSIAHELARLMNGTIEVESTGKGSSFTVTLPVGQSLGAGTASSLQA